jgi:hypothetical protein
VIALPIFDVFGGAKEEEDEKLRRAACCDKVGDRTTMRLNAAFANIVE